MGSSKVARIRRCPWEGPGYELRVYSVLCLNLRQDLFVML